MRLHVVFLVCAFLLLSNTAHAKFEKYPFNAIVKEDAVNVRAGFNKNYETLCQLSLDEKVVVIVKEYSWYKILLPQSASCYVSCNFITDNKDGTGVVTGNNVNVRAMPSQTSSVIGKLNRDVIVKIKTNIGDWFEIAPTSSCYGWVKEEYLDFIDSNVVIAQDPVFVAKLQQNTSVVAANQGNSTAAAESTNQNLIEIVGQAKIPWGSLKYQYPYKVVTPTGEIYYLKFKSDVVDDYHNKNVKVSGNISEPYKSYPVLEVNSISLVE